MLLVKTLPPAQALLRGEDGATIAEAALSLLVVSCMLFGVMECCLMVYLQHAVLEMARNGARYAMVRGADYYGTSCATTSTLDCDATASDVSGYVKGSVPPGVAAASVTVSTVWPGTTAAGGACATAQGANSSGCSVRVSVSYPFVFSVPGVARYTVGINANSTMTITQ